VTTSCEERYTRYTIPQIQPHAYHAATLDLPSPINSRCPSITPRDPFTLRGNVCWLLYLTDFLRDLQYLLVLVSRMAEIGLRITPLLPVHLSRFPSFSSLFFQFLSCIACPRASSLLSTSTAFLGGQDAFPMDRWQAHAWIDRGIENRR
jgi:hypothetical protein